MARIETFAIDPEDTKKVQGPLVRVSLDGGCGIPHCSCSPKPYITVSDGTHLFSVTLTKAEVEHIRRTGWLDTALPSDHPSAFKAETV